MERVDEEGRGVISEGDADHGEHVTVVQVEEVCALAVERHHLVVRRPLRHRLDEHLLVLFRSVSLDPTPEHPRERPLVSHRCQPYALTLDLTKLKEAVFKLTLEWSRQLL